MTDNINVQHPVYGTVVFSGPTLRQKEVLFAATIDRHTVFSIKTMAKKYSNDAELGEKVREFINNIRTSRDI